MLIPTIYPDEITKLFSSILASFAVYWVILKAFILFQEHKNNEV